MGGATSRLAARGLRYRAGRCARRTDGAGGGGGATLARAESGVRSIRLRNAPCLAGYRLTEPGRRGRARGGAVSGRRCGVHAGWTEARHGARVRCGPRAVVVAPRTQAPNGCLKLTEARNVPQNS